MAKEFNPIMKHKRTHSDLIGEVVHFFCTAESGRRAKYNGSRTGVVVSVDAGPRKGFRGVRVRMGGSFTSNGQVSYVTPVHINLLPKELQLANHGCGVLENGKVRPLAAWLAY
jgi:hypothetical protein